MKTLDAQTIQLIANRGRSGGRLRRHRALPFVGRSDR
jgi:hypothetical protein